MFWGERGLTENAELIDSTEYAELRERREDNELTDSTEKREFTDTMENNPMPARARERQREREREEREERVSGGSKEANELKRGDADAPMPTAQKKVVPYE